MFSAPPEIQISQARQAREAPISAKAEPNE